MTNRSDATATMPSSPVALATPHRLATEAGTRIAAAGGNAFDAALAAAAVLCVVYPHNCSLGGDLMAVVRTPQGSPTFVNGSGRAPAGLTLATVAPGRNMPVHGPLTVTVPGVVSGWAAIAARGARFGIAQHLAEAVALADGGFPVSRSLATALEEESAALLQDAGMREVFTAARSVMRAGDVLLQPALARTLQRLREAGADDFYRGDIARRLRRGMLALGVPLTDGDLARHTADLGTPLRATVDGWDVHTAPPNSQGFVLLRLLLALGAARDDATAPLHRALPADVLADLFTVTAQERAELLADAAAMRIDPEELLTDAAVEELLTGLARSTGLPPRGPARPTGDTVAVTAVDAAGNAVSLIQSVFHSFGSMLLEPDTGIMLHNRGAAFSGNPASPNVLAPGKRPAHTLTPVLLESADKVLAVGAMGGMAQPQILTQVISRLLAGEPAQDAVAAPRWVVGGLGIDQPSHTLHVESDVDAGTREELSRHPGPAVLLPVMSEEVGHAQVAGLRGGLVAGSDPRADG